MVGLPLRKAGMNRVVASLPLAVFAAIVLPAAAGAHLPRTQNTVIKPGTSMAGVKLDMTKKQVFGKWGKTTCDQSTCTWEGPGTRGKNERAIVSFVKGKVVQITISAATKGNNLKFKPGTLSKWKTAKGISLGSPKAKVPRAYPAAKPNNGEAVNGYDLFAGARPNLRYTRFSTPGFGASPSLLRSIVIAWDVCHYSDCSGGQ
jgi:hypothetical protein